MKKTIFLAGAMILLFLISIGSTTQAQSNPANSVLAHFTFISNLGRGTANREVGVLQQFLIDHIAESKWPAGQQPTGYFGALTRQALANYQVAVGIVPPAGYFGPTTRAYINKILAGASANDGNKGSLIRSDASIVILNPTTGSVLEGGKPYTILWKSSNLPAGASSHMNILLQNESKGSVAIAADIQNSGSYSWNVPANLPSGTYKLAIGCFVSESIYCPQVQGQPFQIKNPDWVKQAVMTVTSPKLNDVFEKGKDYAINWQVSNFPSFDEVNKTTGKKESIIPPIDSISYVAPQSEIFSSDGPLIAVNQNISVTNTGSFVWRVPTKDITAGRYKIKITCPKVLYLYGCKDAFSPIISIVEAVASSIPSIVVDTQKEGEVWKPGSVHTVQWSAKNIPATTTMNLALTNPKTGTIGLFYGLADSKSLQLTIPMSSATAGQYALLVRAIINDSYIDANADGVITVPLLPGTQRGLDPVTLVTPSLTQKTTWHIGTQQAISFNRNLDQIDYDSYRLCDGAYLSVINNQTDKTEGTISYFNTIVGADGFGWNVGQVIPGEPCSTGMPLKTLTPGSYRIKLSYIDPAIGQRVNVTSAEVVLVQ